MTHTQVVFNVTLTTINCGECGGKYAINERYRAQREKQGNGWTCPYCKTGWGYFGDHSAAARLQKKLDSKERELEQALRSRDFHAAEAKMASYRERAQKAAKTRIKNRVSKGVCPCCTRSFENLQRHMKSQHPEFVEGREQ